MIDYRLLKAFAAVIEEGGFEKAADVLCITQSAVSQRIKQLERELGELLVVRETPPRATATGERLLRHHHQVRELEDELEAELDPPEDCRFRHLTIGVHTDSLSVWLFDALLPFLEEHRATVEILQDEQDRVLGFLREGVAAACISPQPDPIQGCSSAPLGTLSYLLVASPAFRRTWFPDGLDPEAVSRAPVVHSDRNDRLQNLALSQALGRPPPGGPAHYIPSTERYFQLVQAGLGYGLVPDLQAREALAAGSLVELDPAARLGLPLYLHRWAKGSRFLEQFDRALTLGARAALGQGGVPPLRGPAG